jgi:hypothetical protein
MDATHERIDEAARKRRERLTARLATKPAKLPPLSTNDVPPLPPVSAQAAAAEAAEEAVAELEAVELQKELEAIADAVAAVRVAAPPGLGDAVRRQLEAAQRDLAAGLKAKGAGAKGALGDRLADRKARGARMAAAEKEAARRLDAALSKPGAADDAVAVAAALSAAATAVHAASMAETRAAAADIAAAPPAPPPPPSVSASMASSGAPPADLAKKLDEAREKLIAQQESVQRHLDKSAGRHNSAMSGRLAARKAASDIKAAEKAATDAANAAEKAAEDAAAISAAAAAGDLTPTARADEAPVTATAPKQTGIMAGIRQGMRERALAAALVQQETIMMASAAAVRENAPPGKGKGNGKELDAKMMEDMMADHARKIREMQGKVTNSKDAKQKALRERLAKKQAKGNQVAPHTALDIGLE